jgi:alginate O-acetyltransferase complex protein AlgI
MLFNSPFFFIFLTVVVGLNYFLPQRFRLYLLVLASFVFIASNNYESLLALLLFSLFNFYVAKKIIGNRVLFLFAVFVNIAAIVMFNYFIESPFGLSFSFFYSSFDVNSFILALGLSFYSLQNISYLTEVYKGRLTPETNISKYMLYSGFFPKAISGPIMLPHEFIPQIDKAAISNAQLISGAQRVLLGLLKKMVIADRLAPAVHSVFDYNDNYHGLTTLVGVYLFTIQLYFDFSGYSDMALGVAKMLGYDLKENFKIPFRSLSISEFWRRWHISLIFWFTNYIYYPIVFKIRKYKKIAALLGIALTFIVSSMWHGIGFTFIAWAICHIIYLSFELLTKRYRVKLSEHSDKMIYKLVSVFIVFNAVCFSNIFFRAESIQKAFQLITNLFSDFTPTNWLTDFIAPLAVGGHQMDVFNLFISIFITIGFLLFERKINKTASSEKLNVLFLISSIMLILLFGIFNNGARFIYMQF